MYCLGPYKKILQTDRAFHRTERLFLPIFVLETMKKGHQGIVSLDTFSTFKDFIIPVFLEVTGNNLENSSEQVKLLFFKCYFGDIDI